MRGTAHHRDVAEEARDLARRSDVHAVLLGGSVGRGEHRASSGIDLLIVDSAEIDLPVRQLRGGFGYRCIADELADHGFAVLPNRVCGSARPSKSLRAMPRSGV